MHFRSGSVGKLWVIGMSSSAKCSWRQLTSTLISWLALPPFSSKFGQSPKTFRFGCWPFFSGGAVFRAREQREWLTRSRRLFFKDTFMKDSRTCKKHDGRKKRWLFVMQKVNGWHGTNRGISEWHSRGRGVRIWRAKEKNAIICENFPKI